MTGTGDRWGRDSVGRSAPAFMAASTTVLPPLTCTARGRRHLRQLLFRCEAGQLVAAVCLRPVPCGESAGCVCLQCLFSRLFVCLPAILPAIPTALLNICPVHFICFIVLCPVSFHVRQDRRSGPAVVRASSLPAARTVPLAAATRACSGGPCTGPFIFDLPFSLQSP